MAALPPAIVHAQSAVSAASRQDSAVFLDAISVQANAGPLATGLTPAAAGGQAARGGSIGFLGNKDVMETPFGLASYTSLLIENQQARSVADVLTNDPSVANNKASGNDYDSYTIRGFVVNNPDIAFNGLYGIAPEQRTFVESLERIEVLKGPNTFLAGVNPNGSIGGAINLIPKRAADVPLTRLTQGIASGGLFDTQVDVGRRYGKDNAFGMRFNGVHAAGDTAVKNSRQHLHSAALALDYLGERTRLSLDLGFQQLDTKAPKQHLFLPPGVAVPAPLAGNANFSQPWSHVKTKDTYAVMRAEHDLNSETSAYVSAGSKQFAQRTTAIINYQLIDSAGGLRVSPYGDQDVYSERNASAEGGIKGIFKTGPIKHRWNVGVSYYKSTNFNGQSPFLGGAIPLATIYSPAYIPKPPSVRPGQTKTGVNRNTSLALADTLGLWDDRLELTLGARLQKVDATGFDEESGAEISAYAQSALTPSVGLLFRLDSKTSLYGNYIEGLSPGEIVDSSYANGGQILAPYRTRQHEIGAKFDLDTLIVSLGIFEISQPSGQENSTTHVFGHHGLQRNRGIELSLFGEPVTGLRLMGGAMLLDPKLVHTQEGQHDGRVAPGVAKLRATLSAQWEVASLAGLTVLGNVLYSDSQYVDAANTQQIGSWATFGIGVKYATQLLGTPATLRLRVDNVFNHKYWQSALYNRLNPGSPRTVTVSASFDF